MSYTGMPTPSNSRLQAAGNNPFNLGATVKSKHYKQKVQAGIGLRSDSLNYISIIKSNMDTPVNKRQQPMLLIDGVEGMDGDADAEVYD